MKDLLCGVFGNEAHHHAHCSWASAYVHGAGSEIWYSTGGLFYFCTNCILISFSAQTRILIFVFSCKDLWWDFCAQLQKYLRKTLITHPHWKWSNNLLFLAVKWKDQDDEWRRRNIWPEILIEYTCDTFGLFEFSVGSYSKERSVILRVGKRPCGLSHTAESTASSVGLENAGFPTLQVNPLWTVGSAAVCPLPLRASSDIPRLC